MCTLHEDQKQCKPSSQGKESFFYERLLQGTHCPVWQCGNQNCCLKAKQNAQHVHLPKWTMMAFTIMDNRFNLLIFKDLFLLTPWCPTNLCNGIKSVPLNICSKDLIPLKLHSGKLFILLFLSVSGLFQMFVWSCDQWRPSDFYKLPACCQRGADVDAFKANMSFYVSMSSTSEMPVLSLDRDHLRGHLLTFLRCIVACWLRSLPLKQVDIT